MAKRKTKDPRPTILLIAIAIISLILLVGFVLRNKMVFGEPDASTVTSLCSRGDANNDGRIDIIDYQIFANNFGKSVTGGCSQGDFNFDGRVNLIDYQIFANNTSLNPVPPPPTITTTKIYPQADSYVASNYPARNFGSATVLKSDSSPVLITYLKFDLRQITVNVSDAQLYLYVNNSSSATNSVKTTTGSWTEGGINYNNKPTLGSTLISFVPSNQGAWFPVSVTNFVNNNKGRVVTLAITSSGTDDASFASRNSSTNKPYLSFY